MTWLLAIRKKLWKKLYDTKMFAVKLSDGDFCGFLLEHKICPKGIKVSDDLSYCFIKEFCERIGIVLTRYDDMNDIEQGLFDHINEDVEANIDDDEDISEMIEALSQMSIAKLKFSPEFLIDDFKFLA